MRLVTAFLIAAFAASTVDAASYQKIDGTIVAPIMRYGSSSDHHYRGANLEPEAGRHHAQGAPHWDPGLTDQSRQVQFLATDVKQDQGLAGSDGPEMDGDRAEQPLSLIHI